MYAMRIRYVKSRGAWCIYDKSPQDQWYVRRHFTEFATIEEARKFCNDWSAQFPQYGIKIYEVPRKQ